MADHSGHSLVALACFLPPVFANPTAQKHIADPKDVPHPPQSKNKGHAYQFGSPSTRKSQASEPWLRALERVSDERLQR
ncbi:hypothetical protein AAMO2058_000995400 [Amorphochlora amoebiformis]